MSGASAGSPGGRDGLRRALPALALGVFGVSWAAVLVRLADAPAAAVAFWRLVFSLALVLPAVGISGQWRQLRELTAADFGWLGLGGAFLAAHLVTWFVSLELTSVASSTVLVTSHPLFVGALSAAWLGESPHRREWAGIVVAVGGAAAVGWGDFHAGPAPLLGDLLALAGAVLTALYFVVGRKLRPRLGLWSYVAPVYGAAALAAGAAAAWRGAPLTGFGSATWACLAALAVGPMLLGHTSFNWALEHVRAYVVSVVVLLEPLGATVLAVWVLGRGEIPSGTTALGGAALLAGVWLSLTGRRARRERAERDGTREGEPAPGGSRPGDEIGGDGEENGEGVET